MVNFDVEGLRFVVTPPENVEIAQWGDIHDLARIALAETYPQRSADEIDIATNWGNPKFFAAVRINPELDVKSGKLRDGQKFSNPLAAMALEGEEVAGYAYSADNTSNPLSRLKMRTSHKRYAWFREAYVAEDYRARGIAHVLGALSLEARHPLQPVSAYVLKEAKGSEQIMTDLKRLGFRVTNLCDKPEEVHPFGYGHAKPAEQFRLAAPSAETVMTKITNMFRASRAIELAKKSAE